ILAEPYAPLLDSLSQVYLGMASPNALRAYSTERYQFHQVGTGPYRFVEYVPGDRLVLSKNPDYAWGPAFYPQDLSGAPDEIEFRFFTDPPTRTLALESGDVHIVGEVPPRDARALSAEGNFQLMPVSIPGQPLQFIFNTRQYPTDNPLVRQALLYATNRSEIIDTVFQRFSPIAWGPLAAATPFFNAALIGFYSYDANRARSLLAEAGFTDADENGFLEFGGAELTITVIVPPWGQIPEVAQFLQDQWRDVGIRTILNPVPSRSTLLEAVGTGDYNLVAFYEFGADPSFLARYFLTNGVNNWSGVSDPTLDQLLIDAERTSDVSARFGLYSQVQQLIMQQALILPIRDYVNLNAAAPEVSGLAYDAYGWFPIIPAVSFAAN
ncbi:MAG: ABC transporter substrate-binding protein, partial [Anaerolinea sp.]|nr:ABC transporter substrate-binding protein [Anaerolinea sp.]